jgi:hypothetical protein
VPLPGWSASRSSSSRNYAARSPPPLLRQQLVQQAHRLLGRTLLLHEALAGEPHAVPPHRVGHGLAQRVFQPGRILHLLRGAGGHQAGGGGAEVPDVRAELHRHAVGRRLDHVLAAAPTVEAAADERQAGQAPDGAKLADGVSPLDRLASRLALARGPGDLHAKGGTSVPRGGTSVPRAWRWQGWGLPESRGRRWRLPRCKS